DIYSLGTVLYELLTGQRAHPLKSLSPQAIHEEICNREPDKPSALVKGLDRDLDNIVMMALRKEPSRRYASVAEVSNDIVLFLESHPIHARKESLPYRGRKFLGRHRTHTITAALTAGIVILLSIGLIRLSSSKGGPDGRSIAVLPLENLSGDP